MPKEFSRTRRVGEQMQRELAQLIQQEIKDPRLGMVTVSGVDVSRDLSVARVYVTVLGDTDPQPSLAVLNRAAKFLRHALGQRLVMRTLPHLKFIYDESVERGDRLSRLIDEVRSRERKDEED